MLTTKLCHFNFDSVHPSWKNTIKEGLARMNQDYLAELYCNTNWLPGHDKIFNAFSLPFDAVEIILFGESPYPRTESANGYAFWDANVKELWSASGLSKQVNRATSLRNIIKMLLIAEGLLHPTQTTQTDIANLNKDNLISTNDELFKNLLGQGFLLLNATPVLQTNQVRKDALAWQPFIQYILSTILQKKPDIQLLLLGNIANTIDKLTQQYSSKKLHAEHPYNISFITNSEIIDFFRPMHLLLKSSKNNS